MEFEPKQEFELNGQYLKRSKTSLRINYEAQVQIIKNQVGSLDEVRQKLGLNGRKMAQLLLVDPSAWTRWTREGGEPPPHVWRALQWYLALLEKVPGLTPGYFLSRPEVRIQNSESPQTSERVHNLERLVARQADQLRLFLALSVAGWILAGALLIRGP